MIKRDPSCDLCELGCRSVIRPKHICLMARPPEKVDILIVADNPTHIDDTHGRIFGGKGLGEIAQFFEDTGLEVHCAYATRCVKPNKQFKLKDSHVKTCSTAYLREEIKACQPDHIIVLGANALLGATGAKGISEKLGNRYYDDKLEAWVYPTIHQAQAAYDDLQKKVLWENLTLFKKWIMGEVTEADVALTKFDPPIHEINTIRKLKDMAAKIEAADWVVAVDTETDGLNPYLPGKEVRVIQFCWDADYGGCYVPLNVGDGCYWVITGEELNKPYAAIPRYHRYAYRELRSAAASKAMDLGKTIPGMLEGEALDFFPTKQTYKVDAQPYWSDEEWPQVGEILRDLLAKARCIWHNGKFDRLWLHLWGHRTFGYPILCPNILMDSMHVAHMLNENRLVKLKKLITSELGYPTYDIPDKLTKNLSLLFPYAAKDTVASLLLAQKFSEELKEEHNRKLARLYTKVIRRMDALFTKIELRGWPVHQGEAERVLADLQSKLEVVQGRMMAYLNERGITTLYVPGTSKGQPIVREVAVDPTVFASTSKLAILLYDVLQLPPHPDKNIAFTESGGRSTKEDALVHVKKHPFVTLLMDWRGLIKAISTYALPMLAAAKTRGRLTTSYKLHGTTTGRTASGKEGKGKTASGMNLQNLPHDERDIYDDDGVLLRSALVKGIRDIIRPADNDPYDTIVECVPGDTRIMTHRGLIQIKDMLPDDLVVQEDGSYRKVQRVINQGIRETYRITTKLGYSQDVTATHRIRAIKQGRYCWCSQSELKVGDTLAISSGGLSVLGNDNRLIPIQFSHPNENQKITLPSVGDPSLAEYFGYYAGDGIFSTKYVGQMVCMEDPDLLAHWDTFMRSCFNAEPQVINQRGAWLQKFGSKPLMTALLANGLAKQSISEWVWQGSIQVRAAYLRGLFEADGSVQSSKNGGRISMSAHSRAFAQDVQRLLLSLGILSSCAPCKKGSLNFSVQVKAASTQEFQAYIGFISRRKQNELKNLCAYAGYSPSCGALPGMRERVRSLGLTGSDRRLLANTSSLGRPITPNIAKRLTPKTQELLDLHLMLQGQRYDSIASIEPSGVQTVYDLTVEGTSTYQQLSFISHNCDFSQIEIRVAGEYSKDPFILRAYRENRDLHMLRGMRLLHPDEHNWDVLEEHFKELKKRDSGKAKDVRQNAKPVNFGFLYGMGAPKFKQFALTDYDIDFSMSQCVNIRKSFFADHAALPQWYARTEAFAKRNGYVESLSGRRRHLPNMKLDPESSGDAKKKYTESLRQAINTPVQGFASDMKLMSMIEIDEKLPEEWGYIIGEVHDSIVLQCRHEFVQQVIDFCVAIMRRPALLDVLGVKLEVPIDAEGKSGPSLGKAH